ncbi:hypothetical protein B4Q13_21925, partial [Lacticaseibacillus rhamnosus]
PLEGVSCRFRTTQEVELLPLAVEDARIDSSGLAQTMRIELRVTGGAALSALELSRLRFYIHGERRLQDDARLWLGAHVDTVAFTAVDSGGNDTTVVSLPPRALKLGGLADRHRQSLKRLGERRCLVGGSGRGSRRRSGRCTSA